MASGRLSLLLALSCLVSGGAAKSVLAEGPGCAEGEVCSAKEVEAAEDESVAALRVELLQSGRSLLNSRSEVLGLGRDATPRNGKWGPYMKRWSEIPVYADQVCIRNVGGYGMKFNLWDTFTNRVTNWSPTISAQRTACFRIDDDLRDLQEDHPIAPRIFVKGFADSFVEPAIQSVRYRSGAGRADYTCLGSTVSWYCNLDKVGELSGESSLVETSSNRSSERNGKWNPLAREWSLLPVHASEICVRNVGGYAMNFNLWDTYTNFVSPTSGTISAQRTACLDISSIQNAEKDHPVSPRIFAKGWADSFMQVAIQSVLYDPEAGKADYTCLGSTTSWYCNMETTGSLP